LNNLPFYTIPKNFNNSTDRFQHNVNIEEVCNGIVHPITKETITKYTKLMDGPALKDLWVPVMSKKLHHLAQGKEGVTVGTNTIFYLTHAEIRCILKDQTVTYAQIFIDHHPQKNILIKFGSLLAETLSIIHTSSPHVQPTCICKNNVEQYHQYPRSQIWWSQYQKHAS
jgi:hypothetical protein